MYQLNNNKTICFVSALFYPHLGGVERYTHQLSKKLVEFGYNILIITTNTNNINEFEVMDGISIYRLPIYKFLGIRYPVIKHNKEYFKTIKEIKEIPIDFFVINTRFYLTSLLGLALAKKQKKPAIVIEHGTGNFSINNKILDFIGRIYERIITSKVKNYNPKFYGVSHACNSWLKHYNINSSGTFYNGIDSTYLIKNKLDIRKKFSIPENAIIVCFIGRLIEEKGIPEFYSAAKKLATEHADLYFFIAGTGPLLSSIKTNQVNLNNIFILGSLDYDGVMNLLNQSDILVNPSKYPEGLPTIILEAGINKCAVIATPKGGTTELITSRDYGIIIRPGNVEDIINSVLHLKNNKGYLNLISNNLYQRIKKDFDWSNLGEKFINTLLE